MRIWGLNGYFCILAFLIPVCSLIHYLVGRRRPGGGRSQATRGPSHKRRAGGY